MISRHTRRAGRETTGVLAETGLPATGEADDLLAVSDLSVHFPIGDAWLPAVDKVSLRIGRGEIVGLVGESGCGKSTLGMSLLRLVRAPGEVRGGRILFNGRDLLTMTEAEMRRIRGASISLVVQDALAVMNPVTTVGEQMAEVVRDHVGGTRVQIHDRVIDMLRQVHLPEPERLLRRYPHQLSGGMQQRVIIGQALILRPKLIVADEPTTALDVTIQAQILDLLREAGETHHTSVLLITHDLGVVGELCDRVLVMYAGRIVESAEVTQLFSAPKHPYTRALLAGLLPLKGEPPEKLQPLPGQLPTPEDWPSGCRFHPRCPLRQSLGNPARCEQEEPVPVESGHWAACHFTGAAQHGQQGQTT